MTATTGVTPPQHPEPVAERKLWLPKGAQKLGDERLESVSAGVIGPSGTGKSHLLWQLGTDPRYRGRVLVFMFEDSTATYKGADLIVRAIPSQTKLSPLDELNGILDEMILAKRGGAQMPLITAVDSWSGAGDYMGEWSKKNPDFTEKGEINRYTPYNDLGTGITTALAKCRDHIGCDFLSLATTTPPPMPELCVSGKITPRNFTRMHSICLFLQSTKGVFDPAKEKQIADDLSKLPHVSLGRDHTGALDGSYISRFFTTANTGEIPAKGHRSLNLTERAILPNILDKIHGREIGAPLEGTR